MALVFVLEKRSTRCVLADKLLRDMSLDCMRMNVMLKCVHISGIRNVKAGLLSCLQVDEFLEDKDMDRGQRSARTAFGR